MTLAQELERKPRLPKPRGSAQIHDNIWQGARDSAKTEVVEMYDISEELQGYYS